MLKYKASCFRNTELSLWEAYHYYVEAVKKSGTKRMENAKTSVELHKHLMDCGFFKTYLHLDVFRRKYQSLVASWADGHVELIAEAARTHFLLLHGQRGGTTEADFEFRYEPRTTDMRGTRNGILAYVKLHRDEQPTKYNIKCHHFGSNIFTSRRSPPSIIELYSYKLLELITVGPKVQFIYTSKDIGSRMTA